MNKGLRSFLYAELTEAEVDGAASYGAPEKLAGAIEAKVTYDTNDAKVYVDDTLGETDSSITGGTIDLTIDDDDMTVFGPLLGMDEITTGEGVTAIKGYVTKVSDSPKNVGFGYIVMKQVKGQTKYVVRFFYKVKFKPFSSDAKTRGESTEFITPTVQGTFASLQNERSVYVSAPIDTAEEAVAHLKALFA